MLNWKFVELLLRRLGHFVVKQTKRCSSSSNNECDGGGIQRRTRDVEPHARGVDVGDEVQSHRTVRVTFEEAAE